MGWFVWLYSVHGRRVLPPHILPASLLLLIFLTSSVLRVGVRCVPTLVGGQFSPSPSSRVAWSSASWRTSSSVPCSPVSCLTQSRASCLFASGGPGRPEGILQIQAFIEDLSLHAHGSVQPVWDQEGVGVGMHHSHGDLAAASRRAVRCLKASGSSWSRRER